MSRTASPSGSVSASLLGPEDAKNGAPQSGGLGLRGSGVEA